MCKTIDGSGEGGLGQKPAKPKEEAVCSSSVKTMSSCDDREILLNDYLQSEKSEEEWIFESKAESGGKETKRGEQYDDRERKNLIEWTIDLCEFCKLGLATANVAIVLMDKILCTTNVPLASMKLVAGCCVVIASKFEESECAVPKFGKVRAFHGQGAFSLNLYMKMEAAILTELNWKLKIPTVAHFLDLYLSKLDGGVLVSDRIFSSGSKVDSMQAKRRLAQQIILLHSLSIQDFTFATKYIPSIIAASVLLCSRWILDFADLWPNEIEMATTYKDNDKLRACVKELIALYRAHSLDCNIDVKMSRTLKDVSNEFEVMQDLRIQTNKTNASTVPQHVPEENALHSPNTPFDFDCHDLCVRLSNV